MRILLTADPGVTVPPLGYGGIERIVDGLVRHYESIGHEVFLLATAGSTSPASRSVDWAAGAPRSVWSTWQNALQLRRWTREFHADVVHSFSRLAYLGPLLPASIPKIMSYQRHTGGRKIGIASRLGRNSLRFTGCSEFICAMGRRAGGRWHAIPNFVDPRSIRFAPHVVVDAPLLFLSRVESIKGPDVAIAIARASGRRLIIAGNHADCGPERVYWDAKIAPHLGRDGIEYVGEVDDSQKSVLLGQAAALVVPIQWDEPFGIVFAESLAAGTPVITCARGALPEIIRPGETGFFIRSVVEGVEAVRRLPELDRAACRGDAETRFSLAACATQYLALYHELHNARAGRQH
ncbi:MAG: glycosyltransferase [Opitutaceae bacterium]|nr:glycosyltransferase [Opitutaceae bacterium]